MMPLPFGTCSINGVTFRVPPIDEGWWQIPVEEVIEEETHIPYSNINIDDSGGQGWRRFRQTIEVLAADEAAFEASNGVSGVVFVLYGVTKGPAKMKINASAIFWDETVYRHDVEIKY